MQTDDESAALARLALVAAKHAPRGKAAPKETTGLARWVRTLFPQIADWRNAGWTWEDIVEVLKKAAIPLEGAEWEPVKLRVAVSKERRRRERLAKAATGDETAACLRPKPNPAPPQAARVGDVAARPVPHTQAGATPSATAERAAAPDQAGPTTAGEAASPPKRELSGFKKKATTLGLVQRES